MADELEPWNILLDWANNVDLEHAVPGDLVYDWPAFLACVRATLTQMHALSLNLERCDARRAELERTSVLAAAMREFHTAFNLPQRDTPSADVEPRLADLRHTLLCDEVRELGGAAFLKDLVGVAQELADVVYVAYGTALTYGIDLDAVLAEVHRANMSKLQADGTPRMRKDGKVLKSDLYETPDIARVLGLEAPHDAAADE